MTNKIHAITKTAIFAAIIAVSAYIRIPTGIIPLTFQSVAVTLTGYSLGNKYGPMATVLYAMVGLAGLPVFSSGGGPAYILSPTFGYINWFYGVCLYNWAPLRIQSERFGYQSLFHIGCGTARYICTGNSLAYYFIQLDRRYPPQPHVNP